MQLCTFPKSQNPGKSGLARSSLRYSYTGKAWLSIAPMQADIGFYLGLISGYLSMTIRERKRAQGEVINLSRFFSVLICGPSGFLERCCPRQSARKLPHILVSKRRRSPHRLSSCQPGTDLDAQYQRPGKSQQFTSAGLEGADLQRYVLQVALRLPLPEPSRHLLLTYPSGTFRSSAPMIRPAGERRSTIRQ